MSSNLTRRATRPRFGRRHPHWAAAAVATLTAFALGACSVPGPETPEAEMAKLPRKSVAVESYKVSYLEGGEPGGRLVVFVHGTPGDAVGWADYLISAPKGFHYVALDRPGFGESGPDDAVVSLPEQARALAAVVRAEGGNPAILVGHSLGGPIVAQLAVDKPELVAALVVLAGSLDPALENVPFIQHVGDAWPVSALLPRAMRNANREIIALEKELDRLAPRLKAITVPVVIVHGTADDLVPYANVDFMRGHLTGAKIVDVMSMQGQNHFLPWNAKAQVTAAVAKAAQDATLTETAP
jgi:pimeloyl-ACP methyl ester carboxylesterase